MEAYRVSNPAGRVQNDADRPGVDPLTKERSAMSIDRELQECILTALEFEPGVDAAGVGVTAHHGVVTLTGSVKTPFEKWAAERAASDVPGVRALANDIQVLPAHITRRSDTAIAEAAVNALNGNTAVPPASVKLTIRDGYVTLSGSVTWRYQSDAAEYTVARLYGVKRITNEIVVRPARSPRRQSAPDGLSSLAR
jgi:osmotically-inducible protein OsmY